jgi:hypothetical protein
MVPTPRSIGRTSTSQRSACPARLPALDARGRISAAGCWTGGPRQLPRANNRLRDSASCRHIALWASLGAEQAAGAAQ